MLGAVFLNVLRGDGLRGRVDVGSFRRRRRWLSVWERRGNGDRNRQLVAVVGWLRARKRYITGSERGDSFCDVVVHIRRIGSSAARRPATVRCLGAAALSCVGRVSTTERR
eukprot:4414509-Pleurochrysis_carterae.AAC.1